MKAPRWWALQAALALMWGCTWEPITRDATPERLVAGPVHLLEVLDSEARYLLVTRGPRLSIVDWRNQATFCDLPSNATRTFSPLLPRETGYELGEEPVIPLLRDTDDAGPQLYYTDGHCNLRGPYGEVDEKKLTRFRLEDDGREANIFRSSDRSLHLVDPWRETRRKLADDVAGYTKALIFDGPWPTARGLWILEGGKVVQRTVDGEQVRSLGSAVTEFATDTYDRVAYVEGGALYEAGNSDDPPLLVDGNACQPKYDPVTYDLQFYSPCEAKQLVRQRYFTRELETFGEGVYRIHEYDSSSLRFELARDESGVERTFAAWPLDPNRPERKWERTELAFRPALCPQCLYYLDGVRYAVYATDYVAEGESGPDGLTFGVWNAAENSFTPVFGRIAEKRPATSLAEATSLLFLLHDAKDGIGELSLLAGNSPTAMRVVPLASGVPESLYSIETQALQSVGALDAPLLVYIGDAVVDTETRAGFRGVLEVKPAEDDPRLGGPIAADVSSFRTIVAPVPGVLYGVEVGPNAGLWFAAL